jgi:hypothetical protein
LPMGCAGSARRVLAFAASAYCNDHPDASSCSLNSFQGDLGAIVIVAAIVALVVFDLAWRLRLGTNGPLARVCVALMSAAARVVTPRRMKR